MHGSGAGIRDADPGRVAALEASRPEWRGWLRRVRRVQAALGDPAWRRSGLEPPPAPAPAAPITLAGGAGGGEEPLLHGRTLRVDPAAFARLLTGLLVAGGKENDASAPLAGLRPDPAHSLAWLEAVLRGDPEPLARAARGAGAEPGALTAVLGLAALPPLHAVWAALFPRPLRGWLHGHCPLCGAAPVLAELQGLDRARLLRCGRCGSAWEMPWLRCAFCGEVGHERLGSLVPESGGETQRVETCGSCRGYLKSLTTLTASPPGELLVRDLETVELDLVALERGYVRPETAGFRPGVRVAALEPV